MAMGPVGLQAFLFWPRLYLRDFSIGKNPGDPVAMFNPTAWAKDAGYPPVNWDSGMKLGNQGQPEEVWNKSSWLEVWNKS